MSCSNTFILQIVSVVLCATWELVEGESGAKLLRDLPATENQLGLLADDLCWELFGFEENGDVKVETCKKNFLRRRGNFSERPSNLEVICQTETGVKFNITPSNHWQLVTLVPKEKNGFINHKFLNATKEIDTVSTQPAGDYTFWTTVLDRNGDPSFWLQGADVYPLTGKEKIDIEIHKADFVYNNSRLIATFRWNYTFDCDGFGCPSSSCYEVTVANTCNKGTHPMFWDIPLADGSVSVEELPLDDHCSFTIHSKVPYKYIYRTPTYDQLTGSKSLPDKVEIKNVTLESSKAKSGSGWDVRVGWACPKLLPEGFNVTLRTSDMLRSVIVAKNETDVVLNNVSGHGEYNVSVAADGGDSFNTARASFDERAESSSVTAVVTGAWCAVLLIAIAIVSSALCWRKRQTAKLRHLYFLGLEDKLAKDYDREMDQDSGAEDSWEIRFERIFLHEVIGEGAFGVVRRGSLAPGGKEVAVKMLKDFPTLDEIRSFRAEMELMKSVGAHPHVVSLVGCCSGRRLLIVAEYCSRGDLLTYLRCSWDVMVSKRNAKYYNNNLDSADYRNDLFKSKPKGHSKLVVNKLYDLQGVCDAELTSLDLLSFCRQIAMGMEFLASNRVVHRDLAARNVLVSGDRTLKIADFGLSRDVYQDNQYKQKGNGKMPVKWMALESLTHKIYTTQSDVWSFGVVVWEVVTMGGAPYPEVPAARLPRLLRAGYRMPRPNNCSKQLYEVMLSCWRARSRDRPTFAALHHQLDELLNCACADEYLSLELEAEDAPPTPRSQRYVKMILRGSRLWARGESYERPLTAPQSNHYSSPPASGARVHAV